MRYEAVGQLTVRHDLGISSGLYEAVQGIHGVFPASFADTTSLHQVEDCDLMTFFR